MSKVHLMSGWKISLSETFILLDQRCIWYISIYKYIHICTYYVHPIKEQRITNVTGNVGNFLYLCCVLKWSEIRLTCYITATIVDGHTNKRKGIVERSIIRIVWGQENFSNKWIACQYWPMECLQLLKLCKCLMHQN